MDITVLFQRFAEQSPLIILCGLIIWQLLKMYKEEKAMLRTEEAAFILQHRIDLKKYLDQFHGMKFTRNQNGWISGNVLVKPDNQWSDGKNWGNIVNWEARKNSCYPTQAVGIINSRVKAPYQFKSPHFQPSQTH